MNDDNVCPNEQEQVGSNGADNIPHCLELYFRNSNQFGGSDLRKRKREICRIKKTLQIYIKSVC